MNDAPRAGIGRTALLALIGAAAAGLALATPWLIRPWRDETPWYESTGTFPRLGLALAAVGALVELLRRARPDADAGAEELDASASDGRRVAIVVALFVGYGLLMPITGFPIATVVFLGASALAIGLAPRVALALSVPLALALWAAFGLGLHVAFGGWL